MNQNTFKDLLLSKVRTLELANQELRTHLRTVLEITKSKPDPADEAGRAEEITKAEKLLVSHVIKDTVFDVRGRSGDYHCQMTGNPELWECGQTPEEALGKWLVTHGHHYGMRVSIPASAA